MPGGSVVAGPVEGGLVVTLSVAAGPSSSPPHAATVITTATTTIPVLIAPLSHTPTALPMSLGATAPR